MGAPGVIDHQRKIIRGCLSTEGRGLCQVSAITCGDGRRVSRDLISPGTVSRRTCGNKLQQASALSRTGLTARRDGVGRLTMRVARNMIPYSASRNVTSSAHRGFTGNGTVVSGANIDSRRRGRIASRDHTHIRGLGEKARSEGDTLTELR